MTSSIENALLQRTNRELAAVLVHMEKLLRLKNWLRSRFCNFFIIVELDFLSTTILGSFISSVLVSMVCIDSKLHIHAVDRGSTGHSL